MKATTVYLTDEQARRLDEEALRSGLPTETLILDALDAFLGIASNGHLDSEEVPSSEEEPTTVAESPFRRLIGIGDSGREERADLWFIGIGRRDRSEVSANIERLLEDDYLRYVWEDSFGGTRSEEELAEYLRARRRPDEDESGSSGPLP